MGAGIWGSGSSLYIFMLDGLCISRPIVGKSNVCLDMDSKTIIYVQDKIIYTRLICIGD